MLVGVTVREVKALVTADLPLLPPAFAASAGSHDSNGRQDFPVSRFVSYS